MADTEHNFASLFAFFFFFAIHPTAVFYSHSCAHNPDFQILRSKVKVKVSFIVNSATCTVHTYRELKLRYSLTPWCIQITLNTNSRMQKYRYVQINIYIYTHTHIHIHTHTCTHKNATITNIQIRTCRKKKKKKKTLNKKTKNNIKNG